MACIPCLKMREQGQAVIRSPDRPDHGAPVTSYDVSDVDCHILTLPRDRQDWLEEAVLSVKGQANLYVVDGIDGHLGASRALGYSYGTSRFVCHVDSDDVIEPDTVRRCVEMFNADPNLGIVFTDVMYVDEHDTPSHRQFQFSGTEPFSSLWERAFHFWVARRQFVIDALRRWAGLPTLVDRMILVDLCRTVNVGCVDMVGYRQRAHAAGMGAKPLTDARELDLAAQGFV